MIEEKLPPEIPEGLTISIQLTQGNPPFNVARVVMEYADSGFLYGNVAYFDMESSERMYGGTLQSTIHLMAASANKLAEELDNQDLYDLTYALLDWHV